MAISDEHALSRLKQKFGGSIKLRSGVKGLRYRLHHKEGILELVYRINGHIRNSIRLVQLKKVCDILNIPLLEPKPFFKAIPLPLSAALPYPSGPGEVNQKNHFIKNGEVNIKTIDRNRINNGWFSGFFDADGTITFSFKNGTPQLTISVSNKLDTNIQCFKEIFGGNIYFDKSGHGYFKWSIQSKQDIENFLNYFKIAPSRSHKRHRLFLVKEFFELKRLKAYNQPSNSGLYKVWLNFEEK